MIVDRYALEGKKQNRRHILEVKNNHREKRSVRYFNWFNKLLKMTFFGMYLKGAFNLKAENREVFRKVKPPFLILPNHQ